LRQDARVIWCSNDAGFGGFQEGWGLDRVLGAG